MSGEPMIEQSIDGINYEPAEPYKPPPVWFFVRRLFPRWVFYLAFGIAAVWLAGFTALMVYVTWFR